MNEKYAVLGYNTINIGDDVQSLVTSTLLDISYIVARDDYDKVYDYNTGELIQKLDENIFLIMNGWFMHNSNWRTGNDNIKFPIKNDKIIPIYISCCFSQDVPLMYTQECIDNYKRYSPILCRDTTTYDILLRKGVSDVEFFGCVTQLLDIDNIPDDDNNKEKYQDSIIYIDCPNKWNQRNENEKNYSFNHYIHEIMNMNPKQRIDYARNMLSKYKYAKKIYASRLHAFLPCRAMGIDVEYVGHDNYRVKDLVTSTPDKKKLEDKFFEHVKSMHKLIKAY